MITYLLYLLTLREALSLNTLDTLIHYMHMLLEISQTMLQLVNIVSGFFPWNPLLVHVKTIQLKLETTFCIAIGIIESIRILKEIH